MKTLSVRLEAASVSGGKYWEVEVEGCDYRIRFGKLGQSKDWSVKTFETNEEAMKEAEKKMRAKLKKGYAEVASETAGASTESQGQMLSFEDADALQKGELRARFEGDFESVLYFDGDLQLKGDFLSSVEKLATGEFDLIVVTGNLTVEGRIALYDYTPSLIVQGITRAETLEGGDCEVYVDTAILDFYLYGFMSDGILETGELTAPYVINYGHHLVTNLENSVSIDNYGDDPDYQFGSENIKASFVKAVLSDDYEDDEDEREVDVGKLYSRLKAKKTVLKKGAMTTQQQAHFDIGIAILAKDVELDLRARKLDAFPLRICEMSWLKRLNIGANNLGSLPAEISKLTNLEELYVDSCNLVRLPKEIGELKSLRILSVAGNLVEGEVGFALPDTIGELTALEELNISGVCGALDSGEHGFLPGVHPVILPSSMGNLRKLKKLIANYSNPVFPSEMLGMESMEEISMNGGTWLYLVVVPKGLGSFPNLKKLDLGSNFFLEIPDELCELSNLEELNLSTLYRVTKPLPDLSRLSKLRVLKFNGNSPHTGVPNTPQSILAELFTMDLPALEELAIDRWGESTSGYGDDKVVYRDVMSAELISEIGRFKKLRKIDFSFNGLQALPDSFYTLKDIEEVDFEYANFSENEQEKIMATFPNATFRF